MIAYLGCNRVDAKRCKCRKPNRELLRCPATSAVDTRVLPTRAAIGKDKGIDQCRWTVRFVSPLGAGVQARRPEAGKHQCTAAARAAAAPASCVDGLHPSQFHVDWHSFIGMMVRSTTDESRRREIKRVKNTWVLAGEEQPTPCRAKVRTLSTACCLWHAVQRLTHWPNRHSWPGRHLDEYPTKCWSAIQPCPKLASLQAARKQHLL